MTTFTYHTLFARQTPNTLARLATATAGIAGAGGLGSNCALMLARAGIGKLIIADFDAVAPSNLDRQSYFLDQIGMPKVIALQETLCRCNPFLSYVAHNIRVKKQHISSIFASVDIMIEAFDTATDKKMLIEYWLDHHADVPIIGASGVAGYGNFNSLHIRKIDNFYLCGDEKTEITDQTPPMAPRVNLVAAMQANLAIELLLKK